MAKKTQMKEHIQHTLDQGLPPRIWRLESVNVPKYVGLSVHCWWPFIACPYDARTTPCGISNLIEASVSLEQIRLD